MKFNVQPLERFMFRVPLLPIDLFEEVERYDSVVAYLKYILCRKFVQEAIYVASPDFYAEVELFLKDTEEFSENPRRLKKFIVSALCYVNRMCTRCTPFGLFAGCGVGRFDGSEGMVPFDFEIKKNVELDGEFLFYIADCLLQIPEIRLETRLFKNNTIYKLDGVSRYIEFQDKNRKNRVYNVSVFDDDEVIDEILSMTGRKYKDIVLSIVEKGYDRSTAEVFLNELMDSKIVVSELEPFVLNQTFFEQVYKFIARCGKELDSSLLGGLNELMTGLQNPQLTVGDYRNLLSCFGERYNLRTKTQIKIDTFLIPNKEVTLSEGVLREIKNGLKYYFGLCEKSQPNGALQTFKTKFYKRYESAFVRLTEALDPELGIGYGFTDDETLDYNSFIDDIPIPGAASGAINVALKTPLQRFLFNETLRLLVKGEIELELDEKNNELSFDSKYIPATFNACVRLVREQDGGLVICFNHFGADSATAIMGRFSLLNDDVAGMYQELCDHEDKVYGNKIVAEVNHLSEYRVSNIIARKNSRKYELPYINCSDEMTTHRVDVNDLYIGFSDERLVLWDKRLEKEVIPVISNAHNYDREFLPVYRFLGDFQFDSANCPKYLSPDMDFLLTLLKFKPRIRVGKCYYSNAVWKIEKKEIQPILLYDEDRRLEALFAIFKERHIPRVFFLVDGDNKLYVNFDRFPRESLLLFEDAITKVYYILVEECDFRDRKSIFHNQNGVYNNELVIPFKSLDFKDVPSSEVLFPSSRRTYFPVEAKWLYLKIYCGIETKELLLTQHFSRIVSELYGHDYITKWFFVRYADSSQHLRVRFLLSDTQRGDAVLGCVNEELKSYMGKEIASIQLDTYQRELERYGDRLMEVAETVFCLDSEFCIELLPRLLSASFKEKWLFSLIIVDVYLNAFDLTVEEKCDFVRKRREAFEKEYLCNKYQKVAVSNKYREHKELIESYLSGDIGMLDNYGDVERLEKRFLSELKQVVEKGYDGVGQYECEEYLSSFIHMSLLRFFKSRNRFNEYIVYACLDRYLKQEFLMNKYQQHD